MSTLLERIGIGFPAEMKARIKALAEKRDPAKPGSIAATVRHCCSVVLADNGLGGPAGVDAASAAYQYGETARSIGNPVDSCLFRKGTPEYADWEAGWHGISP